MADEPLKLTHEEMIAGINSRAAVYYALVRTWETGKTQVVGQRVPRESPKLFWFANPLLWAAEETVEDRPSIITFYVQIDPMLGQVLLKMGMDVISTKGVGTAEREQ